MKIPEIHFFAEEIKFILPHKKKVREWISFAAFEERKVLHSLNFIFCRDEYLLNLNNRYLHHDTFTDIITFDNSDNTEGVSGEFYISIDRVKENSRFYSVPFSEEMHRVMIHGVLHLFGYDDKTQDDKASMRNKEDYYLSLLPNFIPGF